jgi:hypothetical protein
MDDGTSGPIQSHGGLQVAYGLSDKVDLRARYEVVGADGWGRGYSVIGLGAKFGIIEDKLAFYLPLGRAIGDGTTNTWSLQPTALMTLPIIQEKIEVTLAPKYIASFCQGCANYGAANLGFSLSSDVTKWAIRPEYGLLFNPESDGVIGQFSIGFTAILGAKR